MTRWSLRIRLGIAGATLSALAATLVGSRTLEAEPATPVDSGKTSKPIVVGVRHCVACHENPPAEGDRPDNWGQGKFDEVACWRDKDWHSFAAAALESDLGKKMSARMYDGDANAAREKSECLSCHGIPKEHEQNAVGAAEGVTCTVCHGASEEWIRHHWLDQDWKSKRADPSYKMTDLADPVVRAETCASCHVGDLSQGRVVTHKMFAAGHPPLPPFEAVAYARQMPPHWNPKMADVPPDGQEPSISTSPEAILGVVATFRRAMQLLAQSTGRDGGWPRFEQLDCYSCHHDLRTNSWRQARQSQLDDPSQQWPPGRPRPREWELTFLEAVANAVDAEAAKEFREAREVLLDAFKSQPFGDPEKVSAAAGQLVAWSNDFIGTLSRKAWDRRSLLKLLQGLCDAGQSQWLDRDAARQLAWVISVIAPEAMPPDGRDARPRIESLSALLQLGFQQDKTPTASLASSRINTLDYRDRERFEESAAELELFASILDAIRSAVDRELSR